MPTEGRFIEEMNEALRLIAIQSYELYKNGEVSPYSIFRLIGNYCTSESKEERKLGWAFIKKFLNDHGLKYTKITSGWKTNVKPGQTTLQDGTVIQITEEYAKNILSKIIFTNLSIIENLDKEASGASSFLSEKYGIKNFGRFSTEQWLAQYNTTNENGPYGLVLIAQDDWTASSYDSTHLDVYDSLRKDIESSQFLRIVETRDLPTLTRLVSRINKKHGQPNFVVLSGHGNINEFYFGPAGHGAKHYKYRLASSKDFQGEGLERFNKHFIELFSKIKILIFDACSEDVEENLPRTIRGIVPKNINIISPSEATGGIKDFGAKVNTDGVSFRIEYRDANAIESVSETN